MKKGWQNISFGELGRVFNGNSISEAEKKAHFEGVEDGVPYIGTKDVSFEHEVAYESGVKIPDDKRDGFKLAPANTVLVCAEGGSAGRKIAHTDREIYFGNKLFAVCPSPPISSRLIFYYCLSGDFTKQFKGSMAGLIGGVSINKFKELSVPVPPLAEQQRIVGLLDEAFEGLATAQANAEKNLQNARALFESHLQSVFTQRGPGWVEKPLGDFCSFENGDRGTNYPSKSTRTATGIPFINAGHLTDDGIDLETMDFIPRERFDLLSNGKIRKGDILFCLRGSLGKFASVGDLSEGAIASSLVIVRPDKTVLNDFLVAYFRSPLCTAMINRFKNGAAQPNLSAQSLRNFIAPVPPLAKQESVVEQLTDLREETQRLARLYERKLAALEALKKSLLHQAFTGAL